MDHILLIDCCSNGGVTLNLNESTTTNRSGKTVFRGKFQEAEAVNKNKRSYPYDILENNRAILQEAIKDRRLIGELDHPTDSIVHFANASHLVTKLWWEGSTMMGEGEILNTPSGKVLKALLEDGVKVGISSRGVGNGKVNEDGVLVIGEGYKLITFDAVADPSTFDAFQEKVVSGHRNESRETKEFVKNATVKNEASRIDTINKEALIACIGGIINSKVEQSQRRG